MAENVIIISAKDLDLFKKEVLEEVKAIRTEVKTVKLNYMRSGDVMEELGISSSHLQKMRIKKTIPFTKLGDTFFYPREEIRRLLDTGVIKAA